MKIGKYLTISDISKSQTAIRKGIDNTPCAIELEAIKFLVENVFDKVKDEFPDAFVSSFFRNDKLNKAIGGAIGSQHSKGEAVDIDSEKYNKAIFDFIKNYLQFDQLIWEFGNDSNPDWVHVSLKRTGNRKQILKAFKNSSGKTLYTDIS